MEAGSSIGATLALPQIAAVARLSRKLGIPVSRPAVAASSNHDVEMWVRAVPEGDEISLALEGWTPRSAARRGRALRRRQRRREVTRSANGPPTPIAADAVSASGREAGAEPNADGQPLTRVFRLEETDAAKCR